MALAGLYTCKAIHGTSGVVRLVPGGGRQRNGEIDTTRRPVVIVSTLLHLFVVTSAHTTWCCVVPLPHLLV